MKRIFLPAGAFGVAAGVLVFGLSTEKPASAVSAGESAKIDLTSPEVQLASLPEKSGRQSPQDFLETIDPSDISRVAPDVAALPLRPPLQLSFRDPAFPEGPARRINWKRAESRIREHVSRQTRLRAGVVVKDLKTGHTYVHNADRRFASASLVKIPIVAALYGDFESGRIDPFGASVFRERHRASGSGWLKSEQANQRVSQRDLIYMMLAKSDNTATNILAEDVGMDRVTEFCRNMGWGKTDMVRGVMELHLRKKGIENWTTPRDMASMLEGLYRGEVVSASASRDILRFMNNPPIADRLPKKLPDSIDVVHKTGLIHDNAHDVGILYLPGEQPVLVVALVDRIGTRYRDAKSFISELARILYEESVSA